MSKQLNVKVQYAYMRDGRREFVFHVDGEEEELADYRSSFEKEPIDKDGNTLYFARCFEDGNMRIFWGSPELELEAAVNGGKFDLSKLVIRENADSGYWDLYCTGAK